MIRRQMKGEQVRITFAIPEDVPAGRVSVVGDFNDWTPGVHTMIKRANGMRSVAVTVPTGTVTRFRYLGENGRWFDDPDADARDREDGVLIV